MNDLIERWRRAGERASEEKIRVVSVGDHLYATSGSKPLAAYQLTRSADGWRCECVANREYGLPCKHLSALADLIDIDVFSEVAVAWPEAISGATAA